MRLTWQQVVPQVRRPTGGELSQRCVAEGRAGEGDAADWEVVSVWQLPQQPYRAQHGDGAAQTMACDAALDLDHNSEKMCSGSAVSGKYILTCTLTLQHEAV